MILYQIQEIKLLQVHNSRESMNEKVSQFTWVAKTGHAF